MTMAGKKKRTHSRGGARGGVKTAKNGAPKGPMGNGARTPRSLHTLENVEHPAREIAVPKDLTPQQVALFAAMLINGGNITRAAETVGLNASYARRFVSKHPLFRESLRQYGKGMQTNLQEWLDLVPQAKASMVNLLQDPDGRVRYLAAKDILDRAEGKPISKVDMRIRDERPQLSEGEVQLAFSLMKERGISYAQAVAMIRDNPEDAAEWIAANAVQVTKQNPMADNTLAEDRALLPRTTDAWQDAEVLPDEDEDEAES